MNGDNQHPKVAEPIRKTSARSKKAAYENRFARGALMEFVTRGMLCSGTVRYGRRGRQPVRPRRARSPSTEGSSASIVVYLQFNCRFYVDGLRAAQGKRSIDVHAAHQTPVVAHSHLHCPAGRVRAA